MKAKGFQNISQAECISVSASIMANANQKWHSGKLLAENNDFGGAISLSIVSLEEQIKALLLLADGNGFQFRKVKGMNAIFQNHGVRYIIAYYIFVMAVFGEDIFRFIYRMRDNPDHMKELITLYKTDKSIMEKKAGNYLMRKLIHLSHEMEWFSKIDLFRQDGFYSDYDGELKTPIIITQETYIETMERLIRVRFAANEIMRVLQKPDEHFLVEFNKMRKQFKQDQMYEKIGTGLQMVKQTKHDPFAFMKDWFHEFRNQAK